MKIAVLANAHSKAELLEKGCPANVQMVWANNLNELTAIDADAYFDLLFENKGERISSLQALITRPVFIHSVDCTLSEMGKYPFIRINGWPGFINRKLVEIAVINNDQEEIAVEVLTKLQWSFKIAPDIPGMISGRIIAMIINEAYFSYGEGVSSKAEIDIAMKQGTSYPFGPFEWSRLIGLKNIYALLIRLCNNDDRYAVSDALVRDL